ncbi:MAG: hypothetical protein JWL84_866 [Rhodospirillales bacterium]|jgi:hypothetical protein|nr:hypothetical protein [Rhodospirillales bacterium]
MKQRAERLFIRAWRLREQLKSLDDPLAAGVVRQVIAALEEAGHDANRG